MMRVLGVAALVLFAAGCIDDRLVACGDGRACPRGTVCAQLVEGAQNICPQSEEIDQCAGKVLYAECGNGDIPRACYESSAGLVCLPSGCGNGLRDPQEVCDDGNAVTGDGCSVGCTSNETCGNGIVDPLAGEQCDDGNWIGHDGCADDCQPESPLWSAIITEDAEQLFGARMAYDLAHGRMILFGGAYQASTSPIQVARNATWSWDGVGWQRLADIIAPSQRATPALAYDADRRRIILFGGATNAGAVYGDTWEHDGRAWTLRVPMASPPPRYETQAVYDPVRKRVVMFGGLTADGSTLDDTWEYDGVTWQQIQLAIHPGARSGHGMAYDPRRAVIVMAGGRSTTGGANDTWEYDGTWRPTTVTTPADLVASAFAFDGTGVLAFGGSGATAAAGNTYRYTGQQWQLLVAEGTSGAPLRRRSAMLAWDPVRQRTVLFGGLLYTLSPSSASTLNDTWTWNGSQWTPMQPTVRPAPRVWAASAYDVHRARLVVHGGADVAGMQSAHADTWEFDGGHWQQTTGGPSARLGAAMAYDIARRQTVLFGGQLGVTYYNDTWLWNGTGWTQGPTSGGPSPRAGARLAFDLERGVTLLFGGTSAGTYFDETWEWNGTTWRLLAPATKPAARVGHVMIYDPVRGRVIVHGGEGPTSSYVDTWEWDGTSWSPIPHAQAPSPRNNAAAAWHSARASLTIFGGSTRIFNPLDDTWELTDDWRQLPVPNPPSRRQGLAGGRTRDGAGFLAFGGIIGNAVTDELLELRWVNNSRHEVCTLDVDEDRDGKAGCVDPDCWSTCSPLCPPGVTMCDPSWPVCGDGTCSVLENCRICPGDCTCTPVCGDSFCDGDEATTCKGDC